MDNVTQIFCKVDDFCQELQNRGTPPIARPRKRIRQMSLSASEIMTILILFHLSGYRTFKHFYLKEICQHWRAEFPHLVSYSRFVELEPGLSPNRWTGG